MFSLIGKAGVLIMAILALVQMNTVRAQTPEEIINSIQNNVQVTLNPQYPRAGDAVNIHLHSNSTDLTGANISWTVNGATVQKGIGSVDYTVTAGKVGSRTTVGVNIITVNGSSINRQIVIQPADVDIIWQAASYTPPFYKGKALYPYEGLVIFTAVPTLSSTQSITASMNSLVYSWKRNGETLGSLSGYGKNTLAYQGTVIAKPVNISVEVSDLNGVFLGRGSVTVQPQSPVIGLYQDSPSLGVLHNRELSTILMDQKELSIATVPYFYSAKSQVSNLEYTWNVNGRSVEIQNDPTHLVVRHDGESEGRSSIGVRIVNLLQDLQFNNAGMEIYFTKQTQ